MGAAIITTNKGGRCGVCQEDFGPRDQQVTHVGGENHDGFHRPCLARWVVQKPICPWDQQAIDPNSLTTRTDRIMARLRPALANAVYAACFGIIAGAGAGAVGIADLELTVGLAAVIAAQAATMGRLGGAAGIATLAGIAGALGGIRLGGGIRGVAVGVATGIGIDWILNRREVDEIARKNIENGMTVGAFVSMVAVLTDTITTPLTAIAVTSLFGGGLAGILSLIRR